MKFLPIVLGFGIGGRAVSSDVADLYYDTYSDEGCEWGEYLGCYCNLTTKACDSVRSEPEKLDSD